MKKVFAIILFLLALPLWRYLDVLGWIYPHPLAHGISTFIWSVFFITIPLSLFFPRVHPLIFASVFGTFSLVAAFKGPLSGMAAADPEYSHCSLTTYTGVFYPIHYWLSDSHADDLEIRNQLCWIRKMIARMPGKFENALELENYSELIRKRLLIPKRKYRVALPLVLVLQGKMILQTEDIGPIDKITFADGANFWIDQYTEEVRAREYSIWNWPHGDYIKMEYGLIENNWNILIPVSE